MCSLVAEKCHKKEAIACLVKHIDHLWLVAFLNHTVVGDEKVLGEVPQMLVLHSHCLIVSF